MLTAGHWAGDLILLSFALIMHKMGRMLFSELLQKLSVLMHAEAGYKPEVLYRHV